MWAYVEGARCRRRTLLEHFGDRSMAAIQRACCDVCAPELLPALPTSASVTRGLGASGGGDLDSAIVGVVASAQPPVGRTRAVEILRGGRSKVVAQHSYDGLTGYGAFAHLRSAEVLGRVDELLQEGTLRSTGGRFPKLQAA
jgi:ATP-dependent DNA helicase RecQ